MKQFLPIWLLYLGLFLLAGAGASFAADTNEILIFSFFRGNGEAGIYLAASEDGRQFTPLNHDQPVMKPAPWKQQNLTRDPSMVFHDGKFHAVWTSSWKGNCFGYAESPDLVRWTEPVKVEPFPTNQIPNNSWAPEICWDPLQKNFMIVWASTIPPFSHRLFVTRTTDGKTFSEARVFFDQKRSNIDAMLVFDERADEKRWVMAYKHDEPPPSNGHYICIATAPADFSQPWSIDPTPVVGPGTSVGPNSLSEAPSLLKTKAGWNLYWDCPLNKTFHLASSPDLKTWTDCTAGLQMPANPRHGTVFRAPRAAVGWLK